ncbi:MAG: B12-binding domain-containing radical SAM protein [Rhodospirillaceae bacterium]
MMQTSPDVSLINFNLSGNRAEGRRAFAPLAPLYLAGALRAAGYGAEVLDYQTHPSETPYDPETIAAYLRAARGKIIGISTMTNMLPFLVLGLRRFFAEEGGDRPVYLGGSGVSGMAEEILALEPRIAGVVSGDGEEAITAIADHHICGTALELAPGLTVSTPDEGPVQLTARPRRPRDINHLPAPAYDLLDHSHYKEFPVLTARGCPYNCVFCDIAPNGGRMVGYRDTTKVVEEIAHIAARYGYRYFNILDDIFSLKRSRVEAFCQEIIARGLDIDWACMCRTDLLDDALMALMHQAGCRRLFLGVESGSARVRQLAGKGLAMENVEDLLKRASQYFTVNPSFIVGFPFETLDDFDQTLHLAAYAKVIGARPQMSVLSPLPQADITSSGDYAMAFTPELVSGLAYPRRGEDPDRMAREILSEDICALIETNSRLFSAFYHFPQGQLPQKLARARAFGVQL